MTDADVVAKCLDAAIRVVNELSTAARLAGDTETMYAANRAWHELDGRRRAMSIEKPAEQAPYSAGPGIVRLGKSP